MPALNNARSAATTSTIELTLYASHQSALINGRRFQDDFAVSENGFVATRLAEPASPRGLRNRLALTGGGLAERAGLGRGRQESALKG